MNYIEEQENFEWKIFSKNIVTKAREKGIMLGVTFEIIPTCNLKCKMCHMRLDTQEQIDKIGKMLTADDWLKIADEAIEQGTLFITISGGEPFTSCDFIKIYTELSKKGIFLAINTNGTILNEELLNTLKKYPPSIITITIYGASETTYRQVCGNGKAFYKVIENTKKIKESLPNSYISWRTTIIRDNLNDIEKMKEIAKQNNIDLSVSYGTLKPIRGAIRPDMSWRLSFEEILILEKEKILFDEKNGTEETENIKNNKYKEINYLLNNENIEYKLNGITCKAGIHSAGITWDGKMLPCLIFNSPYELPLKISTKEAWEKIKKHRKILTIPQRCFRCKNIKYCGNCAALVQAESGTYEENETYDCHYNRK